MILKLIDASMISPSVRSIPMRSPTRTLKMAKPKWWVAVMSTIWRRRSAMTKFPNSLGPHKFLMLWKGRELRSGRREDSNLLCYLLKTLTTGMTKTYLTRLPLSTLYPWCWGARKIRQSCKMSLRSQHGGWVTMRDGSASTCAVTHGTRNKKQRVIKNRSFCFFSGEYVFSNLYIFKLS